MPTLAFRGLSLAAALVVLTVARAAHADAPPPRIGVVVEVAVNVGPSRVEQLGAALADALASTLVVDAFGGADVTRRLPPGGLPEECLTTPACVADLGARLDASQLLFLAVVAIGDELAVDATWIDVASGATASRPRVNLAVAGPDRDAFVAAAPRLLPAAAVRPTATEPEVIVVERPVAADPGRRLTTGVWIAGGVGVAAGATAGLLGLSVRSASPALRAAGVRRR
ncbi:MAG: hypothetical protein R2939_01075 [Kofleriaceae bacterium]